MIFQRGKVWMPVHFVRHAQQNVSMQLILQGELTN